MDGQTAVFSAIVTKLGANLNLVGVDVWVAQSPPIIEGSFPYILVESASGGLLNDSPHDVMDIDLLVTGVGLTPASAKTISGHIEDSLKNQVLTYPDGWVSWSTVRQKQAFYRSINIQNDQYHKVGAIYRFRATKSKG